MYASEYICTINNEINESHNEKDKGLPGHNGRLNRKH